MSGLLLDTSVLVEVLRARKGEVIWVEEILVEYVPIGLFLSPVVAAELFYGARSKNDLSFLEKFVSRFQLLEFTASTHGIFLELMRKYSLSHRPKVADALIAVAALEHAIPLFTLNTRDFQFIEGLELVATH